MGIENWLEKMELIPIDGFTHYELMMECMKVVDKLYNEYE